MLLVSLFFNVYIHVIVDFLCALLFVPCLITAWNYFMENIDGNYCENVKQPSIKDKPKQHHYYFVEVMHVWVYVCVRMRYLCIFMCVFLSFLFGQFSLDPFVFCYALYLPMLRMHYANVCIKCENCPEMAYSHFPFYRMRKQSKHAFCIFKSHRFGRIKSHLCVELCLNRKTLHLCIVSI